MPGFGGYSFYPRRCGGGTPRVRLLCESFSGALGTAYSADTETYLGARNHAIARMLDAAWGTNARLGYLHDPDRTSQVDRWETIRGITPAADATNASRRAAIKERQERTGQASTRQRIVDRLTEVCGDVFVDLYYVPFEYAVIHVPDTTYPWGSVVEDPYGVRSDAAPWYSTASHLLALMAPTTAVTQAQFLDTMASAYAAIEPLLPVWTTFTWYQAPETGAAIDVPGGPQDTGMYLDERNLDRSVFAPFPHPGTPGFFVDVFSNLDRLTFS